MKSQTELSHDHVTINIDNKLSKLPDAHQEPFIFKVFERYRKQNKRAYEPELLAIGPYNRSKTVLIQTMEEHKLRYLQLLLTRRGESSVKRYVEAIRGDEEKARRCYATVFGLDKDQFVELLVVDGLFIVELCRKFSDGNLVDKHDMIFKLNWIHHVLWRDMLLFENQIPFFVVEKLFKMTRSHEEESGDHDLVDLLLNYYCSIRKYYHYHTKSLGNNKWLLESVKHVKSQNLKHVLALIHLLTTSSFTEDPLNYNKIQDNKELKWEFIASITELHETGIKFKAKHDCCLFNVTFANGTLEIPLLTIEEKTEGLLRNMIAYEQCQDEKRPRVINDYTTLLYCLIKSSKDVGLLRKYGILNNLIGDDESASKVVSGLSGSVFVSHDGFCYKDVFNGVNEYYRQRRHIWAANLSRNYFNTPWAIISFIAAVVLLFLTFTQTLTAVIPFFGHSPPSS
ncbi:putative UPF0481 protein At3g02645 [Impatiens glandulifera]|uniref:putative UPF0481 protein At3g02645 n=1 Tax=Impatiens glandulifera TaxID=253017 RepID=UPI001FB094D1|nr:putative UPF0481 protein At3g02645 [Impatiens glandulifera]